MHKIAMITGASRGIGRAIAIEFAKQGYHLILTCIHSTKTLDLLSQELSATYGICCYVYTGDGGDATFIETIMAKHSSISVLVNNAGISHIGLLSQTSLEEWNHVISTNLTSVFLCSKGVIPGMLQLGYGKIINISSIWGNVGASMEVAYSTSKGGINSFTKALAKELGPSNIQVNAIACGLIDTEMNHCFSKDELNALVEEIPANRMGTTQEVAHLAVQLATGNEYLTGQIISLDGGFI